MKCIRSTFCIVLSLVGLLYATVASPARAAEQPALVVELESVKSLIQGVSVVSSGIGQDAPPAAMITGGLGSMLSAPGLAGIDTDKPLQLFVFLPKVDATATTFDPTTMVPRTAFVFPLLDGKVYASAVDAAFPGSKMMGDIKHLIGASQSGEDVYTATVFGRAVVGTDLGTVQQIQKFIAAKPAASAAIVFPGIVRVRFDMAACIPFVEALQAQIPTLMGAQPMPPNMPMKPAEMADAELSALLMLMRELRSYTLGIQVSPSAVTILDRVTPMSNTKTAKWIMGMKQPSSTYMQVLPEDAMMASANGFMNVVDLIVEPYADLMAKIYGAMGPPMNEMGPLMRDVMLKMKGLYAGDMALGIVPAASGKGVGLVELIALTDAAKAEKVFDEVYAGMNQNWGKAMPDFTMIERKPREHGGVKIKGFAYEIQAVTNPPVMAMPAMQMKWMEALKWEMAFVDDHLVYTCGAPEIMDGALDRLKSGGTPIDKTAAFTHLFPALKANVVEAHTLSLCSTLKALLQMVPGIDQETLAAIPDDTAGMAGYSVAQKGNLIGVDRISFGEIQGIQAAFSAMAGAMPALMQHFGMPGMEGIQPMPGQPGAEEWDAMPPVPMQPYEK